jgi:exodeoxyribonuclease VII large subunit
MLNTVKRRFSNVWVDIIPVSVQGADAIPEIVAGLSLLNRLNRSDVAVLARGGGSLEDLQAFNSEAVAMAIADSRIPVVSAVGHETDYTIADFVADLRAPTPSAAIEMILPRKDELSDRIDRTMRTLKNNYNNYINNLRYNYASIAQRLVHPLKTVQDLRLHLDDEFMRLGRQIRIQWQAKSQQLAVCAQRLQPRTLEFQLEKYKQITEDTTFKLSHTLAISISDRRKYVQALSGRLSALNPLAVLDRGYSITRTRPAKTVVTRTEQVRVGQPVDVILARGRLQCQVEGKSDHGKKDL